MLADYGSVNPCVPPLLPGSGITSCLKIVRDPSGEYATSPEHNQTDGTEGSYVLKRAKRIDLPLGTKRTLTEWRKPQGQERIFERSEE